jgi:hypothetical protein
LELNSAYLKPVDTIEYIYRHIDQKKKIKFEGHSSGSQ